MHSVNNQGMNLSKVFAKGGSHLQGQKKQKCFHTVVTAINEVTQEQVVCVRALSSDLEQLDQIVKLAVNITANLYIESIAKQNVRPQKRK